MKAVLKGWMRVAWKVIVKALRKVDARDGIKVGWKVSKKVVM